MTDTRRPPACHFDPAAGYRVTREHRDDCADPSTHNGCVPCTAPHCVLCRRAHATNDHPLTCPECIGKVRADLDDIRHLCRHLRWQAVRGGRDGRLIAAAPIPGGDAMVLLARAGADADDLITSFGPIKGNPKANLLDEDHHPQDVVPPLLPLIGWDYQWRHFFGHHPPTKPSVTGITHYLANPLPTRAQAVDGPDWVRFADDIAALRRQLEGVLHDEREPERGIGCFECDHQLVRKFGDPNPCRHRTPGRAHLDQVKADAAAARRRLQVLATYPELGPPTYADERAARRVPTSAEESAARRPCHQCTNQGGIVDPSIGQSWECTGCRKAYTPGEYANAVRAHLLKGGPDGDGWTHITMAAEAATTQTGLPVPASTVRKWMDRGKVAGVCRWTSSIDGRTAVVPQAGPGRSHSVIVAEFDGRVVPASWGSRLVFWPDVADQAARMVVRSHEAEVIRRLREHEKRHLAKALAAGEALRFAAERLGINAARARRLAEEIEAESRQAAS